LLRTHGQGHQVIGQPGLVKPRPANPWINLALFVVTVFSVVLMGALNAGANPLEDPSSLVQGIPFAFTLLAILGTHELGHYFAARRHKVAVTLPYFIPMPLSFVGTFGAFIQLRSPVRNRSQLFDVGVAGPLAGLVITIPLLLYGLYLSEVGPLPAEGGYIMEGNSLLYLGAKYLVHGQVLPRGVSRDGLLAADIPDVVLARGKPVEGATATGAVGEMKAGDVFIKGANALNYAGGIAGLLVGHPTGGTLGAVIGTLVARRIRLLIPVGLEKETPSDIIEASQQLELGGGSGPSLWPMQGDIFTEVEALRVLCGVDAVPIGAGGVAGAEGAVWLACFGDAEEIDTVEALALE